MWKPQQHAISAKIDEDVNKEVDKEMSASGIKRNALINMALRWYLTELDEARRKSAQGLFSTKYILNIDTKGFTAEELDKLKHICRGFGCTEEHFITHLLQMAIQEYDNKPLKYMP